MSQVKRSSNGKLSMVFNFLLVLQFLFILFFLGNGFAQSPTDIPGLKLWLKSDSGILKNGNSVFEWKDLSGNPNNGLQNEANLQPAYVDQVLNNNPALRFDGIDDVLNGTKIPNLENSSITIFVLASGGIMSSGYHVLFNLGPFAPGGFWMARNGESYTIYCNNTIYSSGTPDLINSGFGPTIFEYVKEFGIGTTIFQNGIFKNSNGSGGMINSFFNDNYNIGRDPTYSGIWSGDLFEIILFDKNLNDSERIIIENYLFNKYAPSLNLGPDKSVCSFPYIIKANANYIKTYLWSDGSSLDSLSVTLPGIYYLTVTDIFNRTSSDTIIISEDINPYSVNLGNDTNICEGNNLILNAGPDNYQYLWSNGSSLNSINISVSGTYGVTVTDCIGNISSDSINIVFKPLPVFNFNNSDSISCFNAPLNLQTLLGNDVNYQWSTGSIDSSIEIINSGIYSLRVTNTFGCQFSDTTYVKVDSSLAFLSLGPDSAFCSGNSINLVSDSGLALEYLWSDNSNLSELVIQATGDYSVKFTNFNGCFKSDTIHVDITGIGPVVDFAFDTTCIGSKTDFLDLSTIDTGNTIVNWHWDFGVTALTNDTSNLKNPDFLYPDSGKYLVSLATYSNTGCVAVKSKNIIIYPKPKGNFDFSMVCNSTKTNIRDKTESYGYNIKNWEWNFGDPASGIDSISFLKNPIHIFSNEEVFQTKLIVTSEFGCRDTSLKNLNLKKYQLLPNELPGLKLWLKADTGVTHINSKITDWKDQSGNNYDAFQSNSENQPLFMEKGLNNYPFIKFDGINDVLSGVTIPNLENSSLSIFIVASGDTMDDNYNVLFNLGPYVPGGLWLAKNSQNYAVYCNNAVFSSSLLNLADTGFDPIIFEYVKEFGNYCNIYQNGLLDQSINTAPFVNSFVNGSYNLGGDPTYTGFWNGGISELLLFDQALSDSNRILIENYLNAKYAPSINICPDTILVCSFPYSLKPEDGKFSNFIWQDGSTDDSLIINSNGKYYVTAKNNFGLTSSDTVLVLKDTLNFSVKLGSDTNICIGELINLDAGPSHLFYTWSNGVSTDFNIVDSTGQYYVSVTDCNSNKSFDTININVQNLPVFDLGTDTVLCFNDINILDPGILNSQNLFFKWSNGSQDSILKVINPGSYSLTVRDFIGCQFLDSIKIKIDSSLINMSLGSDSSFCSGNEIALITAGDSTLQYLWSDGTTKDYLPVILSGQYWLEIINDLACSNRDSINITITGIAPEPKFLIENSCQLASTIFIDKSIPNGSPISSWVWSFGDGDSSNLVNPIHQYINAGDHLLSLTVTASDGCNNVFDTMITIYPSLSAKYSRDSSCVGKPTNFYGIPDTSAIYYINSWNWNFGDPVSGISDTSSLQNPIHTFGNNSSYEIKLFIVSNSGCKDSLIEIIRTGLNPIASYTSGPLCESDTIQFKDNSIFPSGTTMSQSYWNFGNGIESNDPSEDIVFISGTFSLIHSVTATNGCMDTNLDTVIVNTKPLADFSYSDSCQGALISMKDLSFSGNPIINWGWKIQDNDSLYGNPINFTFNDTGIFNVLLTVTTEKNCRDSIVKKVKILKKPVANYSIIPPFGAAPFTTQFKNLSSSGNNTFWEFGNDEVSNINDPVYQYKDSGEFKSTLIITNEFGCKDSMSKEIKVYNPYLDIAIKDLFVLNNNGFITLIVKLTNYGSLYIYKANLDASLNNFGTVREYLSDTIFSGEAFNFKFRSNFEIDNNNLYLCVNVNSPNDTTEQVVSNNSKCISLLFDSVKLITPFPNPTEGKISLLFTLPEIDYYTLTIVDILGNSIMEIKDEGIKGLNEINLDLNNALSNGLYYINLEFRNRQYSTKFMKNN